MLFYADNVRSLDSAEAGEQVAETLLGTAALYRLDAVSPCRVALETHADLVGAAIALGEVHQAVADHLNPTRDDVHPEVDRLARAGTLVGRCVYRSAHLLRRASLPADGLPGMLESAAAAVRDACNAVGHGTLLARVPEGYAFYCLYPEMYLASLSRSLASRPPRRSYTVVGIRSIGTSLATIVAGALLEMGIPAAVETVRPRGHPFDRYIDLSPRVQQRLGAAAGSGGGFVIVDEGPGLTCSSFLSVCSALDTLGADADRISLLSAWQGSPSAYASEEHRARWRRLPVFHTPAAEAFEGWQSLVPFVLRTLAGPEGGDNSHWLPSHIDDLSCGRWREHVYPSPEQWPAVHRSLERTKLLFRFPVAPACHSSKKGSAIASSSPPARGSRLVAGAVDARFRGHDELRAAAPFSFTVGALKGMTNSEARGAEESSSCAHSGATRGSFASAPLRLRMTGAEDQFAAAEPPILAKFAGLGEYGRQKLERAAILAEAGFGPPVLGLAYGFLLHPFMETHGPMSAAELSTPLMQRMVDYYAFLARRFSSPPAERFDRLAEIVLVNTKGGLGLDASDFVAGWRPLRYAIDRLPLVSLDGKPRPHEWLRAPHADPRTALKADSSDHFRDHTLVGEQSILWDLAGVCEEWEMGSDQVRRFLALWERKTGDSRAAELLNFYRAAYLAFRVAELHYAVHSADEDGARQRLRQEQRRYARRLEEIVSHEHSGISRGAGS